MPSSGVWPHRNRGGSGRSGINNRSGIGRRNEIAKAMAYINQRIKYRKRISVPPYLTHGSGGVMSA